MSIGASYVFFLARGGWKDWPPHYTIYSPELKYNPDHFFHFKREMIHN